MPRPQEVTLKWMNGRVLTVVVLVSIATSASVGTVLALTVGDQANRALKREQNEVIRLSRTAAINGCDGSNLLRGDARLLTHRLKPTRPDNNDLSDWLLRLRDCEKTYDQGRIVLLSSEVEYRFLQALSRRHRVAIRDGGRRLVPIK